MYTTLARAIKILRRSNSLTGGVFRIKLRYTILHVYHTEIFSQRESAGIQVFRITS